MKQKKYLASLLTCFLSLLFVVSALAKDDLSSFSDDAKSFSISFPSNWKIQATPIISLHASPLGQAQTDINLKVISQALQPGVDLQKYVETSKLAFKKYWSVLGEEQGKLNGVPFVKLILLQNLDGKSESKNLKYFIASKDNVFTVTLGVAPSEFEKNLALFEKIWSSFKILK